MNFLRIAESPGILTPASVEALAEKISGVCSSAAVVLAYLHGSYVRGTPTALSDIDLAVLLGSASARDRRKRLDILLALQEACGRDEIDLVVLDTAGPIIRDRVARYGRIVYARSEAERIRFEARAVKDALDFDHFSRAYDEALFHQLAAGKVVGR